MCLCPGGDACVRGVVERAGNTLYGARVYVELGGRLAHAHATRVVISAVAENDVRYVVQSGGVANGAPERWSSTHTCRCSSPLARPATALMACRPATARKASPSRRARAQRQR